MSDPAILICVGAAKAGTSWLYRALHEHPECHMRAVKEVHYWDTFDAEARAKQVKVYARRRAGFHQTRDEAEAAKRGWQVRNMNRRIADMGDLLDMLDGDRSSDDAYLAYLCHGAGEARLVGDLTPGYALLSDDLLARMVAASARIRVVYLMRDPLARLWSHIRMQAERQKRPDQEVESKANATLWRILNKGHETHLTARGDYAGAVAKLRRVVPEDRLMVAFAETMYTGEGFASICTWLGLTPGVFDGTEKVHEGPKAAMRADLRPKAVEMLRDQYDWVAEHVGPLPAEWRANLEQVTS